jgi:hypothetical protein
MFNGPIAIVQDQVLRDAQEQEAEEVAGKAKEEKA